MAADCRVSQVVDVRKGVHCMIPKSLWTAKAPGKPAAKVPVPGKS